jgi:hypothetical protein
LPAAQGCPLAKPRISPPPPPIRSRCLTPPVHELPPLRLRQVAGSAHCRRWNETNAGDHYLGYPPQYVTGGEGGIRTRGRLTPTPDFESGTFGHSATSPSGRNSSTRSADDMLAAVYSLLRKRWRVPAAHAPLLCIRLSQSALHPASVGPPLYWGREISAAAPSRRSPAPSLCQRVLILSSPPRYGRSTAGMPILPSAF